MSDKSSQKSDGGPSAMVMQLLQEVSLARLMADYASRILAGTDPEDVKIAAREDVMSAKWLASRDVNVKIYSIKPHPLNVEVVIAATSVGLIVLKLGTAVDTGNHFGIHPLWRAQNMVLAFSDSTCQKCLLQVQGGIQSVKEDQIGGQDGSEDGSVNLKMSAHLESPPRPSSRRLSSANFSRYQVVTDYCFFVVLTNFDII